MLQAFDDLLGWIASRAKRPRIASEPAPPTDATIDALFHIMEQADHVNRAARQCVQNLVRESRTEDASKNA